MFDGGKWSKRNEVFVLEVRNSLITFALLNDYSVIVDDTNLDFKHEDKLRRLADSTGAEFEIKDFTDVTLEECITRNRTRRDSVPTAAIISMWNRYLKPKDEPDKTLDDFKDCFPEPMYIDGLPDAVQFDLDGTLALFGDNNPYDRNCLYDTVNYPVFDELRMHQRNGDKIIILSGRKGDYEEQTKEWLRKNGIKPDLFIMRAKGDERPDTTIKPEMFWNHVAPHYNVRAVYDDRDGIVDTWRSMGLTCFQVAPGSF